MAGVHGLEHVKSLFAAYLAHHDAIRTHTETVDDELALPHRTLAFNVGGTRFQPYDMFLLQLQLGRILDGDDAIGIRDVSGKNVEKRGLAGAGSSRNEQVQAALDHGRE